MSLSPWVSSLMASACLVGACRRGPTVQVLGDSTRLEARASSPRESSLFDGTRVTLFGARGETLGFQVRVSDGRKRTLRLELPSHVARVSAFEVRSLEVLEPSTDMYGPSNGTGSYPDVLVPVT